MSLGLERALPRRLAIRRLKMEGSAVAMNFPSASFDVIVCQQGLQFFPDRPGALREMRRVLVPSGRVLLSVWRIMGPYHGAVVDALRQHVGAEAAATFPLPESGYPMLKSSTVLASKQGSVRWLFTRAL